MTSLVPYTESRPPHTLWSHSQPWVLLRHLRFGFGYWEGKLQSSKDVVTSTQDKVVAVAHRKCRLWKWLTFLLVLANQFSPQNPLSRGNRQTVTTCCSVQWLLFLAESSNCSPCVSEKRVDHRIAPVLITAFCFLLLVFLSFCF